jgi:hypothetical protein
MNAGTETFLCGEATDDEPANEESVLRLSNFGTGRNVYLHIDDIIRSLATVVPPPFADLIEIATYVYVADQSHTRGGGAGVEDMGANWRRRLHFEIPVRCPDLCRGSDIALALRDTLSFLSEDEYSFAFRRYKKPPPPELFFNFAASGDAVRPESVILFSGGLDSLGGAVQEVVVDGRPVM